MRDAITLTNSELKELTQRATSRTGRAEDSRRARLILLLAEGHTWDEVSSAYRLQPGFCRQLVSTIHRTTHRWTLQPAFGQVATVRRRNWNHGFWRRHDMHLSRPVGQPTGARANSEHI